MIPNKKDSFLTEKLSLSSCFKKTGKFIFEQELSATCEKTHIKSFHPSLLNIQKTVHSPTNE